MNTNEHINDEGNCYCGSLDCLGNMRVMADSLATQVGRLEKQAENYKAVIAQNAEAFERQARIMRSARLALETYLDSNEIEIDSDEALALACAELGIESTKEIDIFITMKWHVTAAIPRGYDADEWLAEQEFSAELETSAELNDTFPDADVTAETY